MTRPLKIPDHSIGSAHTATSTAPWWAWRAWRNASRPSLRAIAVVAASNSGIESAPPSLTGFNIVSLLPVSARGGIRHRQIARLVLRHNASALIVHVPMTHGQILDLAALAERLGCAFVYPAGIPLAKHRPSLLWHGEQPFFALGIGPNAMRGPTSKRFLDLVVSASALLLLSPILLAIGALVRLDSSGPALFTQPRAGLHGRRFRMLKFRTMRRGADDEKANLAHLNLTGDPRLFKVPDDPRVTRIGRFLRRWSLDELPQLWNVLIGEMSLVGPRPFFESDLADYDAHHFRRLVVKPGITGYWQVRGRSDIVDFEEVVQLDREYIAQWSFWVDIGVLLRTIPAVLQRSGAY